MVRINLNQKIGPLNCSLQFFLNGIIPRSLLSGRLVIQEEKQTVIIPFPLTAEEFRRFCQSHQIDPNKLLPLGRQILSLSLDEVCPCERGSLNLCFPIPDLEWPKDVLEGIASNASPSEICKLIINDLGCSLQISSTT